MPVRAVIFDFGGVLLRTEDQGGRTAWERRLGMAENALADQVFNSELSRLATLGRASVDDVWAEVGRANGLTDEALAELRRDFWSGDVLDARLVDYIGGLRPRYRTGILSNAWADARAAFVEIYGLGAVMDEIVVSAEEGIAKPDPRIFSVAAERLGVAPDEAVFVDDLPANVEAARAAGMCGVHFRTTEQAIADVERCLQRDSGGPAPEAGR